jgi:hypothetical protein
MKTKNCTLLTLIRFEHDDADLARRPLSVPDEVKAARCRFS